MLFKYQMDLITPNIHQISICQIVLGVLCIGISQSRMYLSIWN